MKLREWQTEFQNLVLGPAVSQDQPPEYIPNHLDFIQQDAIRSQRLEIYQNAYQQRLSEALRSNFPCVHELLGDEEFYQAAKELIFHFPPQTASIRWYGAHFPDYLKNHEPYKSCPAIAELAQFEWVMRHAIDAKDAERITVEQLENVLPEQWANLCFKLHPSVTILSLKWNAVQVWQALDSGSPPPQPMEAPAAWLIYRKQNLMNAWQSAEPLEIQALEFITTGNSFGDLCAYLLDQYNDSQQAISQAAVWLKTWTEQGLLLKSDSLQEGG